MPFASVSTFVDTLLTAIDAVSTVYAAPKAAGPARVPSNTSPRVPASSAVIRRSTGYHLLKEFGLRTSECARSFTDLSAPRNVAATRRPANGGSARETRRWSDANTKKNWLLGQDSNLQPSG